jgi:copper transport protein
VTFAKPSSWLVMIAIAIASVVLVAGPAAAHLDLVSTTPSDGAVKTKPVTDVQLEFSVAGKPAGDGIQIIDRSGSQVPADVTSPDGGITWVATPSEPLPGGKYGVKWSVASPDAHPKTGAFRFSVELAAASERGLSAGAGAVAGTEVDRLDALLSEPDVTTAERVSWFGSTMALVGAVLGIGGLAFLGFVMAGRRSEVALITKRVRWSGAVLVVGTLIQIVAQSAILTGGDWSAAVAPTALGNVLSGSFAWSILLRLTGGVLIVVGVVSADSAAPRAALATTHSEPGDPIVKASLRRSSIAMAGAGLYLASFLFDCHNATPKPMAVVWATDVVHVLAAATWVGGIAMLATVLWRRKRAEHALDAAYLAVRFSVVAGASLVLAGIAGLALTVEILDEPSQLWASTWGQVLIAKVLLVAVVAAIGAYNHFRLIPLLEQAVDLRTNHPHLTDELDPFAGSPAPVATNGSQAVAVETRTRVEATSDQVSRKLWFTAYAEVILLLGVVALTAWLVSSSANL